MVGNFLPNQGPEIATVNRDSNTVTVISNFNTPTPVFNTFATGGVEPVQAIAVTLPGEAAENLVIANSGDGVFTLLNGADGLEEEASLADHDLPAPTAIELASVLGDEVSFYAATAGVEAAFTLSFVLPGFSASTAPVPGSSSATAEAPVQLVALTETSLALVGTLLVTMLTSPTTTTPVGVTTSSSSSASSSPLDNETGTGAEVSAAFLAIGPSQGQGFFSQGGAGGSTGGEEAEAGAGAGPAPPVNQAPAPAPASAWDRFVLGVDVAIEQIRQEDPETFFGAEAEGPAPGAAAAPTPEARAAADGTGGPLGLVSPDAATVPPAAGHSAPGPQYRHDSAEMPPALPAAPIAPAGALALAALLVVRASPAADARGGRRRSLEGKRPGPQRGG
jgi:hypothetical protein